jgi:hypothetical protein
MGRVVSLTENTSSIAKKIDTLLPLKRGHKQHTRRQL